jgi:hypothetical protein
MILWAHRSVLLSIEHGKGPLRTSQHEHFLAAPFTGLQLPFRLRVLNWMVFLCFALALTLYELGVDGVSEVV